MKLSTIPAVQISTTRIAGYTAVVVNVLSKDSAITKQVEAELTKHNYAYATVKRDADEAIVRGGRVYNNNRIKSTVSSKLYDGVDYTFLAEKKEEHIMSTLFSLRNIQVTA